MGARKPRKAGLTVRLSHEPEIKTETINWETKNGAPNAEAQPVRSKKSGCVLRGLKTPRLQTTQRVLRLVATTVEIV